MQPELKTSGKKKVAKSKAATKIMCFRGTVNLQRLCSGKVLGLDGSVPPVEFQAH